MHHLNIAARDGAHVDTQITARNLPQLFLKARDNLLAHFRPILKQFGVTEQQWRILRLLDEHKQLEPRELCEMSQIFSSSMTGVLTRMEEMSLIQRNRMAQDQRRVLVRLAPKGLELLQDIAPLIDRQYRQLEQRYDEHSMARLIHTLEDFIAATGDTPEGIGRYLSAED